MLRHPKTLQIQDFSYELPDAKIAQHPLQNRDESKLLVYQAGNIEDKQFFNLPELLDSNALMVFNDTKVVQVRLQFERATGSKKIGRAHV